MNLDFRLGIRLLAVALAAGAATLHADQQSAPTVRHHRVEEQTADPTTPEIDQAEAVMQKQDYSSAEALLQKAVEANPQSYRAWFDLGFVYNATKRTTEAIDAYRKSVAVKSDVFESNLNLGILLARQGDSDEAAKYLKAATQLKPTANVDEGLARAWLSLGLVEESSDPQQALAAYADASKLAPKNPAPHLSAGLLLEKQDKLDAAAREYQAAAALDPKSTDPITGLANVYSKQKKYADAEVQLRKLMAVDPGNNAARVQLGRVLAAEGKNDEAATLLASDKSGPDDPHAALELGTIFVKAGNYPEAEQYFRIAVRGLPEDGETHYALGSVLMQERKYPEAQHELLLAVKFKPGIAEIYGNLAVVAAENKNYDLAIKALEERAKYLPEIPATYFLRATSYDNLKVKAKAIENYQRFLATDAGKMPDQEWQARHRLIAIDPDNANKYTEKK
jgi:Flp pilus assembly protein TadD